jgi:hypothetical protein
VPPEVRPVTPEVDEDGVVIVGVDGPLTNVQTGVPLEGILPANVTVPAVVQIV